MLTCWDVYREAVVFCRAETVRSALDVLAVSVTCGKGMSELCSDVPLPESANTPGIHVLIQLAEGDFLPDPDVQRAALSVINNVVCAPLFRVSVLRTCLLTDALLGETEIT